MREIDDVEHVIRRTGELIVQITRRYEGVEDGANPIGIDWPHWPKISQRIISTCKGKNIGPANGSRPRNKEE